MAKDHHEEHRPMNSYVNRCATCEHIWFDNRPRRCPIDPDHRDVVSRRLMPEHELPLWHVEYKTARGPLGPQIVSRNIRARNGADAWNRLVALDHIDEVNDLALVTAGEPIVHVRKVVA